MAHPPKFIVALTVALFGSVGLARATPIVDQVNLPVNAIFSGNWQQEITAGVTGWLTGVDVFLNGSGRTVNLAINLGPPWQVDAPEFAQSILTNGAAVYSIDLTPAHIFVNIGDVFALGMHTSDFVNPDIRGTFVDTPTGAYAGNLYAEGGGGGFLWPPGWDLGFRTYVEPVPEPSVGFLLAAGLGLVFIRRRLA